MQKFMVISDPHAPLQDPKAVEWVRKMLLADRYDYLIFTGDLFEAASASKFNNENIHDLEEEYEQASKFLKTVREASRGAKCVFVEGNHDFNIHAQNRLSKGVRSLVDYRNPRVFPELQNWRWGADYIADRNKGVFRIGPQLNFLHGYKTGVTSGAHQALLFGHEYSLTVTGHTHAGHGPEQVYFNKSIPMNRWYANAGTLKVLYEEWCSKHLATMNWSQGAIIGEFMPIKSQRLSRTWEARYELFQTREDYLSQ